MVHSIVLCSNDIILQKDDVSDSGMFYYIPSNLIYLIDNFVTPLC